MITNDIPVKEDGHLEASLTQELRHDVRLHFISAVAVETALAGDSPTNIEGVPERLLQPKTLEVEGLDLEQEPRWSRRFHQGNTYLSYAPTFDGTRPVIQVKNYFEEMRLKSNLPDSENKQSTVPSLVNIPDFWAFGLNSGGEAKPDDTTLRRKLDMDNGVFSYVAIYQDGEGRKTEVSAAQWLDLSDTHKSYKIVKIKPDFSGRITIKTGIDGQPVADKDYYKDTQLRSDDSAIKYTTSTINGGSRLAIAQKAVIAQGEAVLPTDRTILQDGDRQIWQAFSFDVEAGQSYEMITMSSVHTDDDPEAHTSSGYNPESAADKNIAGAIDIGGALKEHLNKWETLWQSNNLKVEGDDELQLAIDFALYHLMSDLGSDIAGIGAKIANDEGEGYGGRHFWDGDIFIFPTLNAAQRRALLMYRFLTLDAARFKAEKYGYKGAFYNWESHKPTPPGVNGEGCPEFVYNWAGRLVPIKTLTESVHISADVVYAVAKYWHENGDEKFLQDYSAEIILESNRFLVDRTTRNADGKYVYEHVTGPDEYHEDVTNNAYTLIMAAYTMLEAEKALASGHITDNVRKKVRLTEEEVDHWREVRENLYMPFDVDTLIFSAFDGWDEKRHVDLTEEKYRTAKGPLDDVINKETPPPSGVPDEELTHDQRTPVRGTDVIKQHDTVLALLLVGPKLLEILPENITKQLRSKFPGETDVQIYRHILLANYKKYVPQTTAGSSLSPGTKTLAALVAGFNPDDFYGEFKNSVALMDLSSRNTHATQHGLHSANAGALPWVFTEGFMGIDVSEGVLKIDPRLPSNLTLAERTNSCLGQTYKVTVNKRPDGMHDVTVELLEPDENAKLPIRANGKSYVLTKSDAQKTFKPIKTGFVSNQRYVDAA